MPRPRKRCRCRRFDGDRVFKPRSVPMSALETVELELAELEAMRWCDVEGLQQSEAGERMGISRGTVQRYLQRGRQKLVGALLAGQAVVVHDGDADEAVLDSTEAGTRSRRG